MRDHYGRLLVCSLLLLVGPRLEAHHSFAATFDSRRVGTIRGEVTKVTWAMPHPYVYLDVRNAAGALENWLVEASNARILERMGWTVSTLKPGESLSQRFRTAGNCP